MERSRRRSRVSRAGMSVLAAAGILVGVGATPTGAHPLGDFTINVSTGIVVGAGEVGLTYVVDMAEIPALQERRSIDVDGDDGISTDEAAAYRTTACRRAADGLSLRVDGHRVGLDVVSARLLFPPGQAGLLTLRLSCELRSALEAAGAHELHLTDETYAGRPGWREITAIGDGATITGADVPARSVTDRLRSYPEGVPPSDVRTATVTFRPGGAAAPGAPDGAEGSPPEGLLERLAAAPGTTPAALLVMVVAAMAVGAVHALGPGHGKTLIGAYLVGRGGTIRQAAAVGAAVSVMHTASVLGLGLVVLSAERILTPERIYPWLGLVAGVIALGLGVTLLVSRIHAVSDGHDHGHRHPPRPLSRRGLVALAFAGGIAPSPSALVVLLGSISVGRTALGLSLVVAFSLGLAGSLIAIGALALRVRRLTEGRIGSRLVRATPIVSAGCIVAVGLVLTGRAFASI